MKIYTSILLLFFLSFSSSCQKDKIETIYVPGSLRQMVPYKNGQLIRYESSSGHLIEATISMRSDLIEKASCANCKPYTREEAIFYEFKVGIHNFVRMSIDIRPIIFMTIFSPVHNFQIGGGFDFNTVEGLPQPLCNGPRQYCISSVTLNGKTYANVLVSTNGTMAPNDIIRAYYTVEKGLIGFEYGNGNTYSLKD